MRPSPRTPSRFARSDERGLVVPSRLMLVAIVVVALGAAMYVATTPSSAKKTAPAAHTSTAVTPDPTPSSSPSVTRSSSTPTPKPSATTAPASPKPTRSATPKPSATVPAAAVRRAATFVEVFNNTKRKGLASRAAKRAEGAGWKVVGSDNWYGTIPTSTVYYPRSFARAAKVLARDMGITRLEPAVAPMRNDRLTVILTAGYRVR